MLADAVLGVAGTISGGAAPVVPQLSSLLDTGEGSGGVAVRLRSRSTKAFR